MKGIPPTGGRGSQRVLEFGRMSCSHDIRTQSSPNHCGIDCRESRRHEPIAALLSLLPTRWKASEEPCVLSLQLRLPNAGSGCSSRWERMSSLALFRALRDRNRDKGEDRFSPLLVRPPDAALDACQRTTARKSPRTTDRSGAKRGSASPTCSRCASGTRARKGVPPSREDISSRTRDPSPPRSATTRGATP